jgi:hypothetical protein
VQQSVLNSVYDRAAYDMDLDYKGQPVPRLPPRYVKWADKLLRQKGLR